jgi:hypothetical protein
MQHILQKYTLHTCRESVQIVPPRIRVVVCFTFNSHLNILIIDTIHFLRGIKHFQKPIYMR